MTPDEAMVKIEEAIAAEADAYEAFLAADRGVRLAQARLRRAESEPEVSAAIAAQNEALAQLAAAAEAHRAAGRAVLAAYEAAEGGA